MKRIEIDGNFADLSDSPIGINWQYMDLTEPGTRFAPFSSNIVLPYTPRNKRIMNYGDVIGGSMTVIRNIPEVNFWFGHQKVISEGYLKVSSTGEKGYNCNITGRNEIIEAIEAHTFTEILDQCIAGFSAEVSMAYAIDKLATGYMVGQNNGWILPRTMPDSIDGPTWKIYSLTNGYQHELWISAAAIIKAMENLGWLTLNIWEGNAKKGWESSAFVTDLRKLYTPAWNYHLTDTWEPAKVATGTRVINAKVIDKSEMANFGGKNPFDFLKYLAHLFCAMIYQDGTEFTLVPLDNITDTGAIDLTGKLVNYSKYVNIPKYEAINYIGYKNSDNLSRSYARHTITSPVTPVFEKDLFTFDMMLPGKYLITRAVFNTGYTENSELSTSPLFLFDAGTVFARDLTFEATPSNHTTSNGIKDLTYYDFSKHYDQFQALATKGICYDVDLKLNPYDFLRMVPYKLIRINELGGLFYLNKITNFDPYSGKPAKCEIIKW